MLAVRTATGLSRHWQTLACALLAPAAAWVALQGLHLPKAGPPAWPLLLWPLLAAPLLEEWVLRSLLQQGLQQRLGDRWRARPAAMAASVGASCAFALLHAPAHGLDALWWLVPGLALAELWRREQRLLPCVVLHAWFNACLLVVGWPGT